MSTNQSVPSVFPSVMRTVVPLVVGWVITALTSLGVDFGSERTTAVVTVVISAAYYTLFRVLENAAPTGGKAEKFFGLLLGFVRPPIYPPSGSVAAPARVETLTAPNPPNDPRL
ncbi:membrane protein [Streptomyces phage Keanu]|nr:membrane protein [Streptomyces phage Keanu]